MCDIFHLHLESTKNNFFYIIFFQENSQQFSKVAVFGGQGGYGHKTEVIGKGACL